VTWKNGQVVPEKWKKYTLLETFGFTTEEELASSIVRVGWKDRQSIPSRVASLLSEGIETLVVVKLVPLYIGRQLPNFRVRYKSDLIGLADFLAVQPRLRFTEAWYCQTNVDPEVFSVAGRIRIAEGSHILEQVWRCSPRMIEDWGEEAFRFPYARAVRATWGWRWQIVDLYAPSTSTPLVQRVEFEHSLHLLESQRTRLQDFADAIEACGLTTYSFEYKIVGERVTIIDWDTSDDRRVLEAYTR
jgi:hypothetical protein